MEDNIDFDLNLPTDKDRRMAEMLQEVKFPILGPSEARIEFTALTENNEPSVGAYIIIFTAQYEKTMFGIYKWREDKNPINDIAGWAYLNIESTMVGNVRYVPYKHLKHDSIILICNEKNQHDIIKEKKEPDAITLTAGDICQCDCEDVEIEVKPKPQKTIINFRDSSYLKDIIKTQIKTPDPDIMTPPIMTTLPNKI